MSDDPMEHVDPIEPGLGALFREERARGHAPAASKERVARRVAQTIGGQGGSDGGKDPSGSAGEGTTTTTTAATGATGGASQAAGVVGAALSASRVAPVLWAFLAGGVAGGVAGATLAPPRVVVVERPARENVRPAVPVTAAAPASVTQPGSKVEELPAAVPAPQPSSAERDRDLGRNTALAREKGLLDVARSALGSEDGDRALAAIDRHTSEFPRGQMREEREALAIQALMMLGRHSEAADRGARFRQTYPHSVLAPVVDAALSNVGATDVRGFDAGE